jgi:IcmF-related N-terminal domain
MSSIFYRILDWCRWVFGVVPRSAVGSPMIYLILHYSLMTLLAVLCAYFSPEIRSGLGLEMHLEHIPEWLDRIWCGAMFVLIYVMIRVVLYLMQVLGIEEDSEFPDIEADWQEIIVALERERLHIDDLPLFLVNGLTPQQEQSALETASNIEWRIIAPPLNKASAVIRAYARDDLILVCCTGVGTTNCQQGKISSEPEVSSRSGTMRTPPSNVTGTLRVENIQDVVAQASSATGTQSAAPPMAAAPEAQQRAAPPRSMGAFFGTMAPGGLKKAMETFSATNDSSVKGFGKKRLTPISEMERAIGMRRMQHLCHLITTARRPFCGINGVLQAFPFSWATDVEYAKRLAPAIRDDLVTLHTELQLQFPVVAVVTELDSVSGIREFLLRAERLQPGLRLSRAGSRFAAGAEVNEENARWVIDRAMHWFRGWIYTAFSYDIDSRDNQKLFQMMCEISQRRDALVVLLRDSIYRIVQPNVRLYGAYFTATGRSTTEQGFIRGVLDKLPEAQSEVAWTPQLVRSQRRSQLIAGLLFASALVMTAATIWVYIYQIAGSDVG